MNQIRKLKRCLWPGQEPGMIELMTRYHDEEWGVPLHDDRKLFEFLILDGFQAGLSWSIILNKREGFRKAFDGFDPEIIARYTRKKTQRLMSNPNIIRNRLKIEATVVNAKRFLEIQYTFGTFDRYIWKFANHKTLVNKFKSPADLPATSPESDAMSKDLKQRGFKFAGSTICYAFMQSVGMVNDHLTGCFRYREINRLLRQSHPCGANKNRTEAPEALAESCASLL